MTKNIVVLLFIIFIISCSTKPKLSAGEFQAYEAELNAWHAKRIENVKAPEGWLNLAGLYWLESGINTFGSGEKNSIVFPSGKIANQAGYFIVQGNKVSIHTSKEDTITIDGRQVVEQVIFHPDSSKALVLKSGSLEWNIIKRDTKLGIRLRDHGSETLKSFAGIERYPVDPEFRVAATFKKSDSTHTIAITNVLGQTNDQESPGTLVFTLQGKEHTLDVLKGSKEEFFVIFSDVTSGKETYGGGRFLYVTKPTGDESIYIDFNKSYNPPCVFTPYATCPLPPKQNELSIAINAGEKNYGNGVHVGKVTPSIQ